MRRAWAALIALAACSTRAPTPTGEPPPPAPEEPAAGQGGSAGQDPGLLSVPPPEPGKLTGTCLPGGGCEPGGLCTSSNVCLPAMPPLPPQITRAVPPPGAGNVPSSSPLVLFLDDAYPTLAVRVSARFLDVTSGVLVSSDVTASTAVTRLSDAAGRDVLVVAPLLGFPLGSAIELRLDGPFSARLVLGIAPWRPGPSPSTLGFEEPPEGDGGAAGDGGAGGASGEAGASGDAGAGGEAGASGDAGVGGQAGASGEAGAGGGEVSGSSGQGGEGGGAGACGPAAGAAGVGGEAGAGGEPGGGGGQGEGGLAGASGGEGCAVSGAGGSAEPRRAGVELGAGWAWLGDVGAVDSVVGSVGPLEGRRYGALSTGVVVHTAASQGVGSVLVSGPVEVPDKGTIAFGYRFLSSEFDESCGKGHDDALVAVAMGPLGTEAKLLGSVDLMCGDASRVPVTFPGLPDGGDGVLLGTGWRAGSFGAALGSPVRVAFVVSDGGDDRLTTLVAVDGVRSVP